jgi:S-adenosylmethionine decarboxylase
VQDYDPVGASTMVLMSDIKGGGEPIPSVQVNAHLDKSHITAHTYPDAADPDGICSFRVDIDIATCKGNFFFACTADCSFTER